MFCEGKEAEVNKSILSAMRSSDKLWAPAICREVNTAKGGEQKQKTQSTIIVMSQILREERSFSILIIFSLNFNNLLSQIVRGLHSFRRSPSEVK